MDDTPEAGSARAWDRPSIPPQLICKPVATTRMSYPNFLPDVRVTEDALGSKALTFSGTCVMCLGIREASGRRREVLSFSPAPTSVLEY